MNMTININAPKQTLRGPDGIKLELDANEVYPHDPGMGTPALLTLKSGDTVTFACALDTGEAENETLTGAQQDWLAKLADGVDNWLTVQVQVIKQQKQTR
jgi:hypothetical protein